jgi:hypothetical protein
MRSFPIDLEIANSGDSFFEPPPDGSRVETAFGWAVPRIVEAETGAARACRETIERFRLRPVPVGLTTAEPDYAWPWLPRLPGTAQTGDVADRRSTPHQEMSGTNFIRHDSRLRFAPVHRYARLMIINKSRV